MWVPSSTGRSRTEFFDLVEISFVEDGGSSGYDNEVSAAGRSSVDQTIDSCCSLRLIDSEF